MGSSRKHKKHKKEKYEDKAVVGEKPPTLKLILKVGSSSTPEHSDSPGPHIQASNYTITPDDESLQSSSSFHKKSKKKKKKKDRDHEKHEKKRRHHHKERRKHTYDDSSQDISLAEDSSTETPLQLRDTIVRHIDEVHSPDSASNRESRLCVQLLRQKTNRTPLQRLLDYLQQELEKKDVKQVFAWPVTDQIAPGYSQTITQPMDFSTMRQKIDDNAYRNLNVYISDMQLMCNNAMVYNRPDTMYYKAAKRLLHAGLKFLSCDKLRQLAVTFPTINIVPSEQLGFQMGSGHLADDQDSNSMDNSEEGDKKETIKESVSPKRKHCSSTVESKFEAIPDDLSSDEILKIAQRAARLSAYKLSLKKPKTTMGFLKQKQDGTTTLNIFKPRESVAPDKTSEKNVSLGLLIGKISHGTGQLQGIRDDRRNVAKTVKPLNYGAFGSYAPSYDSTFANLSKDETDLVYETYGDENATVYAESILNFAKDCDYTLTMVDNLLDLLTGGEHRKAKSIIDEHRKFREEEDRVKELMEIKHQIHVPQISPKSELNTTKIEFDQLKTLSEFGIDTAFLNEFETTKDNPIIQGKSEQTSVLLEKLQQVQNDRLSVVPVTHLNQTPSYTSPDPELHLAEKMTESLTEMAKQVPTGPIVPVAAIRKPVGIVPETTSVSTSTNTALPISNSVEEVVILDGADSSGEEEPCVGVGVDFESELREFLESDTALSGFPLHDDKTIEEMLSES